MCDYVQILSAVIIVAAVEQQQAATDTSAARQCSWKFTRELQSPQRQGSRYPGELPTNVHDAAVQHEVADEGHAAAKDEGEPQ